MSYESTQCAHCGAPLKSGRPPRGAASSRVQRTLGQYGFAVSSPAGLSLAFLAGLLSAVVLGASGVLRAATVWPPAMFFGG